MKERRTTSILSHELFVGSRLFFALAPALQAEFFCFDLKAMSKPFFIVPVRRLSTQTLHMVDPDPESRLLCERNAYDAFVVAF